MNEGLTPSRTWGLVFGIWVLLLTGILAHWGGTPGIIQAFRLASLLSGKQQKVQELETQIAGLDTESVRLEKSRIAQEREIRRTLGYAASDEIIFDFTAASASKKAD